MALTGISQLEREPLWDRVYCELCKALMEGKFVPGETIPLRSVATALGTSPTPVRDALLRLTAEGILVQGVRRTSMVPMVTTETFRHILDVRLILEGAAVLQGAKLIADDEIAEMEKLHKAMWQHFEGKRFSNYLDTHRKFHFILYNAARNPFLASVIENIWLRCAPVLAYVIERERKTDTHAVVLAALHKRNSVAVKDAVVRDISDAGDFVLSMANEEGIIHWPCK